MSNELKNIEKSITNLSKNLSKSIDLLGNKHVSEIDSFNLLTNDAKYLITKMYASYIESRNKGISKKTAVYFDNPITIQEKLMPEWKLEDIFFTCIELKKHGYISGFNASNSLFEISMTTEAIAKSENEFKDKLDTVLDYAEKIKSLIPFV